MYYLIYSEDVTNSLALRQATRPAHLARLTELDNQSRLLLAGPCPAIDSPTPAEAGFTGSVIIAEFNDLAAAQDWANNDPYLAAGVYTNVIVKPFNKVLPA
jgi:uncharacterized protein